MLYHSEKYKSPSGEVTESKACSIDIDYNYDTEKGFFEIIPKENNNNLEDEVENKLKGKFIWKKDGEFGPRFYSVINQAVSIHFGRD
jgi:hypothetical protein